jgi:hypothetical protein
MLQQPLTFLEPVRLRLLDVERLIFEKAERAAGDGPLMETPRWGESAHLTEATGSGCTTMLGLSKQPTSPVEGQISRIKMIKRTMYGRAGFKLLRARVLHAA